MANDQPIYIDAIPLALGQLIVVNIEHRILLCLSHGCSCAVRPAGFLRHARNKKHPITKAGREQVRAYIQSSLIELHCIYCRKVIYYVYIITHLIPKYLLVA